MKTPRTDEELIRLAAAGDEEAQDEIWQRHHGKAQGAFLRVFRGRLDAKGRDSQDFAVDVLGKVFRSAWRFDPARGSFSTWFWTITRNQLRDYLEAKRPVHVSLEALGA